MNNLQIGDKVKYIGKYQDSVYSSHKNSVFTIIDIRVINNENRVKVQLPEWEQEKRYLRFRDYELAKINE